MSITITYEAAGHRLRFEGHAAPGDVDRLREAINTFGRDVRRTIVDLTAVTHVDDEIAELFVDSRDDALSQGRDLVLLRKAHGQVDHAIVAAEAARTT